MSNKASNLLVSALAFGLLIPSNLLLPSRAVAGWNGLGSEVPSSNSRSMLLVEDELITSCPPGTVPVKKSWRQCTRQEAGSAQLVCETKSSIECVKDTGACPPGTIRFKTQSGYECVEPKPEYYGGGQAKQTDVLVPEQSSGPSPFGAPKPFVTKRKTAPITE